MKLSEKDRSQLLRMAGNIAGGLVTMHGRVINEVAQEAAKLALATMQAVDKLIEKEQEDDPR